MSDRKLLVLIVSLMSMIAVTSIALNERSAGREMTAAAQAFLESLDAEQRAACLLKYDDASRVGWHFIPKKQRKGVQLTHATEAQRKKAHALVRAALSQVGYDKAELIMRLEGILHTLEEKAGRRRWARDPLRYYVTIFGEPTNEGKWGLSFEGHHLSLNFVVDKGAIVSHTPAFYGSNPAVVTRAVDKNIAIGTRVLDDEELLGFELLSTLSADQRAKAVIAEKAPRDLRSAGETQAPSEPLEGLPASEMNERQAATLRELIKTYAINMPAKVAGARLYEIDRAGFDKIHFAWAGADRPGIGHYYRIQGPTFLIELCNTQPDAAGNPANHVHSFWRDLKYGDFALPRK